MRTLQYYELTAFGPEKLPKEADLLRFVLDIPYLFVFGLIPPICVLNDVFRSGLADAGMSGGCGWEPFQVDSEEYDELVQALLAVPEGNCKVVEAPGWVRSLIDWNIWIMEYEVGIPAEKHYELWQEEEKWRKLTQQAYDDGDEKLALEYHLKGVGAGQKLAEFIMPYVEEYHARRKAGSKECHTRPRVNPRKLL
jgi:hypothetical protein